MIIFNGTRLDDVYIDMLKTLMKDGVEVSPRGFKTLEMPATTTIVVEKPNQSMVTIPERKALLSFYFGEFIWMLSGSNDLEHVAHYLKGWRRFSDDGKTLNGAYGKRIFDWNGINQFDEVYKKLKNDIHCRQAVISIYNPEKDLLPTKDVPCNDFIQFYVRNNKLCCTVYQRSCDIISGLTYDMHMFSMFQSLMAGRLGLKIGNYTHIANSLHLYERDFEMATNIIEAYKEKPFKTAYDFFCRDDYRLENYEEEREKIIEAEKFFREHALTIKDKEIDIILSKINNRAWKEALALLVCYNLRKAGRKEDAKKFYCMLPLQVYDIVIKKWK